MRESAEQYRWNLRNKLAYGGPYGGPWSAFYAAIKGGSFIPAVRHIQWGIVHSRVGTVDSHLKQSFSVA